MKNNKMKFLERKNYTELNSRCCQFVKDLRDDINFYFQYYKEIAPEDIAMIMCDAFKEAVWDIAEEKMELETTWTDEDEETY